MQEFDQTTGQSGNSFPPRQILDAISTNNATELERLLPVVDLNQKDNGDKSYLQLAAETGRRHICEILVRYGADPSEVRGKRQHSLLHTACLGGNYGFASILLELGAEPSPETIHGTTPLHIVARTNQQYLTMKLLKYGANPLAENSRGGIPHRSGSFPGV